jgi:uncharacterized membrane protein YfcA
MWESLAPTLVALPVLGIVAIVAAFVGSVTGGGVTVIFLPVLVFYFGIREAVPIGTLSLLTATISRVVVYRHSLDPPAVTWFNVGSIPATVAGTYLFTVAAPGILTRVFGFALLGAVLWRRLHPSPPAKFARPWFVPLGAAYGFLSGVSVTVASMPAPFFLAYGLRKEAFVGTMGLSVLLGQVAKLGVFKSADLLTPTILLQGLTLAPFMVIGTVLGKQLLIKIPESRFVFVIDAVIVLSGLTFIIRGAR